MRMPVGSTISMQALLPSSLGAIRNCAKPSGDGRWLMDWPLTRFGEDLACLFALASRRANSLRHAKKDGSETPRSVQYLRIDSPLAACPSTNRRQNRSFSPSWRRILPAILKPPDVVCTTTQG
jgi:hypothetical protein